MKDDRLYLVHIGECIRRIKRYTKGGKKAFLRSTLIQDAALRNLQTLAESTQRLSDSFKTAHSDIDWRGIAGFRNILVHDYLGVNIERIWEIIHRDLPQLDAALPESPRVTKKPSGRTARPRTRKK